MATFQTGFNFMAPQQSQQPQQQNAFATGQQAQQPQQQNAFTIGQQAQQPQQQNAFTIGQPAQQPQQQNAFTIGQQQKQPAAFTFAQQPQQNAFFNTAQQPFNAFGPPQTTNAFTTQQPQQQQQPQQDVALFNRLRAIHLAYAAFVDANGFPTSARMFPNEEKCEFDAIMYNRIDEEAKIEQKKFQLSKRRQEEADYYNPDIKNCAPVRLLGVEELRDRYQKQVKDAEGLASCIQSMQKHISTLRETNEAEKLRFHNLKVEHSRLYNRALKILSKVEFFRCYRVKLQSGENSAKDRLLRLSKEMQRNQAKLAGLVNLQDQEGSAAPANYDEKAGSDLELAGLCDALDRQREGLQVLTEILTKDIRDIGIMKKELNLSS